MKRDYDYRKLDEWELQEKLRESIEYFRPKLHNLTPENVEELKRFFRSLYRREQNHFASLLFDYKSNIFSIDPDFYSDTGDFVRSYSGIAKSFRNQADMIENFDKQIDRAVETQYKRGPYIPPPSLPASTLPTPFASRPASPLKDDPDEVIIDLQRQKSQQINRGLIDQVDVLINQQKIPPPINPVTPQNVVIDPNVVSQNVKLRPLVKTTLDLREFYIPENQFWIFLDNNYEYYLPINI